MIIGEIGAVTVLAGGWSASQFDLAKLPGTVIAVNDSAVYAPRWDICISMDRLWSENRFDWMRKQKKPIWLRRSTIKNFEQLEHMTAFDNDHVSTILSDEEYLLNGTHSGFCALNLAYQMRPRDIYLVGFDMTRGPRGEALVCALFMVAVDWRCASVGMVKAVRLCGQAMRCGENRCLYRRRTHQSS